MSSKGHALIRTSKDGQPWLGKCIRCMKTGLTQEKQGKRCAADFKKEKS